MKITKRILCVLLSCGFVFLCSCGGGAETEETTTGEEITEAETFTDETSAESVSTDTTVAETVTAETQTPVTDAPATERATEKATERVTEAPSTNPAQTSYSKAQIVEILKNAVNKTKGCTGNLTVHHKESFDDMKISNVSPGGESSSKLMNFLTGLIVKPSEEDYKFSNGTATTSEGEATQLLLPKNAPFTLSESGVKSAKIENKDGLTHITLTLVSEECDSLTDKPKHNASAIGYLDIAGSFKILKITSVKITYPGSVIDAYIREDGYVSSVTYTVNMDCHGEASYLGISGKADFKGAQTEEWTLKW